MPEQSSVKREGIASMRAVVLTIVFFPAAFASGCGAQSARAPSAPPGSRVTLRVQDSFASLKEARVAKFEGEIGHRLPESYRQFLLANNGGNFEGQAMFPFEGKPAFVGVDVLYGLDLGDPVLSYADLRWARRDFNVANRIPRDLLPIASGPEGQFCIGLDGARVGEVWLWLQSLEGSDDLELARPVAATFDDFLAMGRDVPQDDPPAEPEFRLIWSGDLDAFKKRLEEGLDPNARNAAGETLLMACVARKSFALLLLERQADVALTNREGWTALHFAASHGSRDVIRALIDAGANPHAKNLAGQTPLTMDGANARALRVIAK